MNEDCDFSYSNKLAVTWLFMLLFYALITSHQQKLSVPGPPRGHQQVLPTEAGSALVLGSAGDQTTQWPRARTRGMCAAWIAHCGVLDLASQVPRGQPEEEDSPGEWAAPGVGGPGRGVSSARRAEDGRGGTQLTRQRWR